MFANRQTPTFAEEKQHPSPWTAHSGDNSPSSNAMDNYFRKTIHRLRRGLPSRRISPKSLNRFNCFSTPRRLRSTRPAIPQPTKKDWPSGATTPAFRLHRTHLRTFPRTFHPTRGLSARLCPSDAPKQKMPTISRQPALLLNQNIMVRTDGTDYQPGKLESVPVHPAFCSNTPEDKSISDSGILKKPLVS